MSAHPGRCVQAAPARPGAKGVVAVRGLTKSFDGRKVVGAKASPSAPRDSFSERHGDSIDKAKASVKKLFGTRNG